MTKAFVLLSGGVDSTTCLYIAKDMYEQVEAISIDYGQKHSKETAFARASCERLGIEHHILDMQGILNGDGVMLADSSVEIPSISYDEIEGVSPTYVPFRNGTLLSVITALAQTWVMQEIESRLQEENIGVTILTEQQALEDKQMTDDSSFEGGDGSVMIDLSNVEDASFELLPRGTYAAVISTCEFGHSQNSGQPMWSMQLTVTEGEFENRKLFSHMSFSPKALPMTRKSLAQIAPELITGPFNPEEVASDMEGKAVSAVVTTRKYEGEDRNQVKELKAPTGADSFMG